MIGVERGAYGPLGLKGYPYSAIDGVLPKFSFHLGPKWTPEPMGLYPED